jgi:hypothetical protein
MAVARFFDGARLPESERARLAAEDAQRERESPTPRNWWRRWLDFGRHYRDLERLWLSRD